MARARTGSRARFETKPPNHYGSGRRDTGAGYERWRSYEHDPTNPSAGKTDVYVSHHRLLAVVACYPDDMAVADILQHLDGRDVHHESGCKFDNRPGNLRVLDHGGHSEITQAQMRAWAADAKQHARQPASTDGGEQRCGECGTQAGTLGSVAGDGRDLCLSCCKRIANQTGATIQL